MGDHKNGRPQKKNPTKTEDHQNGKRQKQQNLILNSPAATQMENVENVR